jgi:glycosyltransferase involved in cell wall biosynthesis
MARMSPTLGQVIRDTQVTINGWRFHDMKSYIDERLGNHQAQAASGTFQASLETLRGRLPGRGKRVRIAFISTMPPDATGIASCSFYSWFGSEIAVDLLCPAGDLDWFHRNRLMFGNGDTDASVHVLDVAALLTAAQTNQYEAIILAIGNSDHNLYLHAVLRKIVESGLSDRCVAYVHDPCLLNFVQKGLRTTPQMFAAHLANLYGAKADAPASVLQQDWDLHAHLARNGVMGLCYLCDFGIRYFLVNSAAAQNIVESDLKGRDFAIKRVFHPAFLPAGAEPAPVQTPARLPSDPIIVGSFGVPSHSKRIMDVIGALRLLEAEGTKVRLVLVGFGVAEFMRRNADILSGLDILHHDAPSDLQLINYMRGVDVGVQLRRENLGENSGVVAQLLMLSRPTIVSAVGSFAELGEAVMQIPVDASIEDIASAIKKATISPPSAEAMQAYVQSHSPARFQATLYEKLCEFGLLSRQPST